MQPPRWVAPYIGIRFRPHGRDHDGCDCWGLCRLIWAEQFGLDVPSFATTYADVRDGAGVERTIRDNGTATETWRGVPAGQERPGDAVHMSGFTADFGKHAMHVGVVVTPGLLIHVERGTDAVIANYRRNRVIAPRVLGFYRHQELDDDR